MLTSQPDCVTFPTMSKNAVTRYLSRIGKTGGQAGTGAAKRRGGAAHYRRLAGLAAAKRSKNMADNSIKSHQLTQVIDNQRKKS